MPKSALTKKLFADTLKKLMSSKPLDKISVGEIADAAGLNRHTFYYHFTDKQELVCWIFDSETATLNDRNQNNTILDELVDYMYSEKDFYITALTSDVQNNLREHIYSVGYQWVTNRILSILGERKMDENAIALFAHIFTNAAVGTLVCWAQDGMETAPNQYSDEYAPILLECMEFLVNKHAK